MLWRIFKGPGKAMPKQSLWRFLAVTVLVAMLAGSVSAVSWAFDPDERMLNEEGAWSLEIKAERYRDKAATPSSASGQLFTAGNMTASPSGMLDQNVSGGGEIEVKGFLVMIDGDRVRDSREPHVAMEAGREIPPDAKMKWKVEATFFADQDGFESGDYVEWRLGTYPGLDLPEEFWEQVIIYEKYVGDACLSYESDGTIYLRTVFTESMAPNQGFYITYTYEGGFLPVYEKTPLDFVFPGREEAVTAILLPSGNAEPEVTESGTTSPETGDPEPTEEETIVPETTEPETEVPEPTKDETTVPETEATGTTEAETTAPEPTTSPTESDDRRPGGGGSSDHEDRPSTIHTVAQKESEPTTEASTVKEPTAAAGKEAEAEMPEQSRPDQDNEPEPAEIEIRVAYMAGGAAAGSGTDTMMAETGQILTVTLEVLNNGAEPVRDLRVRDYLPKHVSFLSASEDGSWGILGGRERVTWKIDALPQGESRTLEMELRVYPCTPAGYRLDQKVYWQAEDAESVNSSKDPSNSFDVSGVTVE